MKRLCLLGLLCVFSAIFPAACAGSDVIPEPVIPVVTGSEWCERAEKNLLALGCPEGEPTKKGKSFAEFCRETQENGISVNPECLAGIKSCDAISACDGGKQ